MADRSWWSLRWAKEDGLQIHSPGLEQPLVRLHTLLLLSLTVIRHFFSTERLCGFIVH